MFTEEIDPIHVFADPPDLTARVASARYREINILLHSLALLGDELRDGRSSLPILRTATALARAERALLHRWDEVSGTLRVTASIGFTTAPAQGASAGGASAQACLLQRKPVLVWAPSQEFLRRELRSLSSASSLSVPLSHEGFPWGVIQILRDRAFGRDEALLLWLFAQVLEGILPPLVGSRRHRETEISIDRTTGLMAPDHFRRRLDWEMQRADWLARQVRVVCVEVTEMIHGRPRGQSAPFTIRQASRAVQKALRPEDSVTCLGGLHFVAAMPDTSADEVRRVAEVIREGLLACSAATLPVFDIVTGIATYPQDGRTPAGLMLAACSGGRKEHLRLNRFPLEG